MTANDQLKTSRSLQIIARRGATPDHRAINTAEVRGGDNRPQRVTKIAGWLLWFTLMPVRFAGAVIATPLWFLAGAFEDDYEVALFLISESWINIVWRH